MSSICSSRLFNLRHRSGLSQKEVAARLGISPQCCSHYENGRRVPDIFMLYRFAKFYHVSMAYLLGHPLSETYESPSSFLPSLNTLSSEQLSQVQQYLHFLVYQKQHPSPVPQLPSSRCFASRLKKYRKRLGLTQAAIQPLEVVIQQMIQCCFIRPKERPYQTNNAYAALVRQYQMEQEVKAIVQKNDTPRDRNAQKAHPRPEKRN